MRKVECSIRGMDGFPPLLVNIRAERTGQTLFKESARSMFNRSESPGWSDLVVTTPPALRPVPASDVARIAAVPDEPTVSVEQGPAVSPYARSWRKRGLDLVMGVP